MRKMTLALVLLAAFTSSTAFGDDVSSTMGMRKTAGKYGPAGCGLGSIIFEPDSGFTQIFAATTNGTSANQTFGITTGTSNCASGGGSASAKAFVASNRAALSKDIARGKGETLQSLSELAGCPDSAAVGRHLQRSFRQIFPASTTSDADVSDHVVTALQSDAALSCGYLG